MKEIARPAGNRGEASCPVGNEWKSSKPHAREMKQEVEGSATRLRTRVLRQPSRSGTHQAEATLVGTSEVQKGVRRWAARSSSAAWTSGEIPENNLEDKDRRKLVSEYVELMNHGGG